MSMPSPSASSRPWGPIPGPVDRTGFFEEQRRHRRSTFLMSLPDLPFSARARSAVWPATVTKPRQTRPQAGMHS